MSRFPDVVMDRDMEGHVVLVTGGSRGIGRAISLEFAQRGANVVVGFFRNRRAANDTVSLIEGCGVKAAALKVHMGEEEQISELFSHVSEMFGRLDAFVSNAATGVIRPVEELDAKAWDWTMGTNARSLLLAARHASHLMAQGGSIIALSSNGAKRVLPGYAVVGASKAALETLVRYLAVELAPRVRVNAVSPGVVDTDALMSFPMRDAMLAKAEVSTPARRLVTPEDVARSVAFLSGPDAEMITGHTLVIDGGASLLA